MERNLEQNANYPRAFLELLDQNINRLLAAFLVNELAKREITHYYLSPGHRNAPLMAAIVHHPFTKMISVIDERSAGYRALGYAASTQKCPILVCTSGTALSNYYPALIEAWSSELPLLVISADRTPQQVTAGENQTIIQSGIYSHFAATLELNYLYSNSLSSMPQKLDNFLEKNRPCHINIPFEEPLGNEKKTINPQIISEAMGLLNTPPPSIQTNPVESANIRKFMEDFYQFRSPLIVVGEIKSFFERKSLLPFFRQAQFPFYLDITSGLKYPFNLQDGIIPGFDHPEVSTYLKGQIDAVLHIGGRITSKEYYRFLQNNPQITVFNVSSSFHKWDPALRTKQFLRCPPESLCPMILQQHSFAKWDMSWAEEKIQSVSQSSLSFPQISQALLHAHPEGTPLFLGNSTAIRSFDNFLSFSLKKDIPVYYNRGVSGIEGNIASALGIAEGSGKMTTAVLGDVSFLHDLSSLPSVSSVWPGLIMVLINDGGGGIFNLLPTSEEKDILPYMTTPHSWNFQALAQQFEIPYYCAHNSEELVRFYQYLLERGSGLLEVVLETKNNVSIYRQLKTLREPSES